MKRTCAANLWVLLFFLMLVGCSKEITKDVIARFELQVPDEDSTLNAVLNMPTPLDFSIVTASGNVEDFEIAFRLVQGQGSVTVGGQLIDLNTFVSLPSARKQRVFYTPAFVGEHLLEFTIKDAFDMIDRFTVSYEIIDSQFSLDVADPRQSAYIGGMIDLSLFISELTPSEYDLSYSINPIDPDGKGAGVMRNAEGMELPAVKIVQTVTSGRTNWSFEGTAIGTVLLQFSATSALGATFTDTLELVISDVPDFTFTGAMVLANQNIDDGTQIDFELIETVGISTYVMQFETSSKGMFVYDEVMYESGDEIPIEVGVSSGFYVNSEAGTHELTFMVSNANNKPKRKTSMITLDF